MRGTVAGAGVVVVVMVVVVVWFCGWCRAAPRFDVLSCIRYCRYQHILLHKDMLEQGILEIVKSIVGCTLTCNEWKYELL